MFLPEEAMRRHCQDLISTGRKRTKNKETHWGTQRRSRKLRQCLSEGVPGSQSLPVCCQSKLQMPGPTRQSLQWPGTCSAPHTGWPLRNSTCYRWSRGKTSQHRWKSLPQQHLLSQGYLNKQHSVSMESPEAHTLVRLISEITRLMQSLGCFPVHNESKGPTITRRVSSLIIITKAMVTLFKSLAFLLFSVLQFCRTLQYLSSAVQLGYILFRTQKSLALD